jgi:DMSO/TMAO reductase YedYZ molybdopterin-dependent catalytic subunit
MSRPYSAFSLLSRKELLTGLGASLVACAEGGGAAKDSGLVGADASSPAPIPSITPNQDFYVTSCCGTPEVDGGAWTCEVRDEGALLATFDLELLTSLEVQQREHTLQCIGSGPYNLAISNAMWGGLPLRDLLELLGVVIPADAVEIVFTSADGYHVSVPIADLDSPLWLVWRMNGVPLPAAHGYPLRLLTPGRYGMKNPKWIVGIEFVREPHLGFWEELGWSKEALYLANTLTAAPRRRMAVQAGPLRAQGMAFAGRDPIAHVELRVDGGEWRSCALDYQGGPDVWTLWHVDLDLEPGEHILQARCTTEAAARSAEGSEATDSMQGYDGSMEVEVTAVA